jgi:hypothetical protein
MLLRKSLLTGMGALLIIALLVPAAAKPGGKPGGGGETPTGTVYMTLYQGGHYLYEMDAGGGSPSAVAVPKNVGEPSHALHGGQRWFLATILVSGAYPDGSGRREVFAYREDGEVAVQLTNQADLQPAGFGDVGFGKVRWTPDDAGISFIGQRWENGAVVESGIYAAEVVYDGDGNVSSLAAQPTDALVEASGLDDHHWSPDGGKIVHASVFTMTVVDVSSGDSTVLSVSGGQPVWSPDGTRIAYVSYGNLYTCRPDGTDDRQILRGRFDKGVAFSLPHWSPTGGHLICWGFDNRRWIGDVYRITSEGDDKTNLTGGVSENARPVAWR